jgi:hypothetical protein
MGNKYLVFILISFIKYLIWGFSFIRRRERAPGCVVYRGYSFSAIIVCPPRPFFLEIL